MNEINSMTVVHTTYMCSIIITTISIFYMLCRTSISRVYKFLKEANESDISCEMHIYQLKIRKAASVHCFFFDGRNNIPDTVAEWPGRTHYCVLQSGVRLLMEGNLGWVDVSLSTARSVINLWHGSSHSDRYLAVCVKFTLCTVYIYSKYYTTTLFWYPDLRSHTVCNLKNFGTKFINNVYLDYTIITPTKSLSSACVIHMCLYSCKQWGIVSCWSMCHLMWYSDWLSNRYTVGRSKIFFTQCTPAYGLHLFSFITINVNKVNTGTY